MTRVTEEELDYPGDGLYYHDGKLFTGVVVSLSDEGWVLAEEELRDGLLAGWKRAWHRPGALACEAQCDLGVLHGLCREWDEDGHLVVENSYEYGIRVSGKCWDSGGRVVEEFHLTEADPAFIILQVSRAAQKRYEEAN
jgi:antitoxin component YwqK of YwqJK toxin-antitoxin module